MYRRRARPQYRAAWRSRCALWPTLVSSFDVDDAGLLAHACEEITESNAHDSACTFHLYPRTGMLAVFPAWLVHWVAPYRGRRPRISVAANLR